MPGGDGTGPMGMGPMTGRGAGFCSGFSTPGYTNFGGRFGMGFGFGRGRGFGRRFFISGLPGWNRYGYASYSRDDEKNFLKGQAEFLENQLEQVQQQLNALNNDSE